MSAEGSLKEQSASERVVDSMGDLLTNVVAQLKTVQGNIQSCHETSITLDSGVDTSDRLEQVDNDLAFLIREITELKSIQDSDEPLLINNDNTNSIMENISLALSSLELNANRERVVSGTMSEGSEDDSLERMVDQLFKNVRSLKSILVEPEPQENVGSDRTSSDDNSDQLSKLIELMSNSISANRTTPPTVEEGMKNDDSEVEESLASHNSSSIGSTPDNSLLSEDSFSDQETSDMTADDTMDSELDSTTRTDLLSSITTSDTEERTGRSTSTSLEYGFIPLNYTITGTISQCNTPSEKTPPPPQIQHECNPRPHKVSRVLFDKSQEEHSTNDSGSPEERSLGLLPEFPVPLKRNKDMIDIYNKIKTDMSSISRMIEPSTERESSNFETKTSSTDESGEKWYEPPKMISESSGKTVTSNESRDGILSDLRNELVKAEQLVDGYKPVEVSQMSAPPSSISEALSAALTSTSDQEQQDFLELMQSVGRVNDRLQRFKRQPNSPGEVRSEEAEWDTFTPVIESPIVSDEHPTVVQELQCAVHAVPESYGIQDKPSSTEADEEVEMITNQYPESETSTPEVWKAPKKQTSESLPLVTELINNLQPTEPTSAVHFSVNHRATLTDASQSVATQKSGESIDDIFPDTGLLKTLLAKAGLTIVPIAEKVSAGINTSFLDETSDRTSQVSSIREEEEKQSSQKSSSVSASWQTKPRPPKPPKLQNLTKQDSPKVISVGNGTTSPIKRSSSPLSSTLSEAMGSTKTKSSLSEKSAKSNKPTIIVNKNRSDQLYNVPPVVKPQKILTFDTWTNTEPKKKVEERGMETSTIQMEDRALSPIKILEYPPLTKMKKTKPSRSAAKGDNGPVAAKQPPRVKGTFSRPPDHGLIYNGMDIPDLTEDPEHKPWEGKESSPEEEGGELLPGKHLPSVREEDEDSTLEEDLGEGFSSDDETEDTREESQSQSTGIEVRVKGKPSEKKDKLEGELNKALLDALQRNRQVNPTAVQGLKDQLQRQTGELENARQKLRNARDRVRSMASIFNMSRPSESPLEDNM